MSSLDAFRPSLPNAALTCLKREPIQTSKFQIHEKEKKNESDDFAMLFCSIRIFAINCHSFGLQNVQTEIIWWMGNIQTVIIGYLNFSTLLQAIVFSIFG